MAFDLFSKRKRRHEESGTPVTHTYDRFPDAFRTQVVYIWHSAIGAWFPEGEWSHGPYISNRCWKEIENIMGRELGVAALAKGNQPMERCVNFLLSASTDGVLDIVELSFRAIDRFLRRRPEHEREKCDITQEAEDAIRELNQRFQEHAIGYQYVDGELLRVDSHYMHTETVEPAIALLHKAGFTGPNAEFLAAHEHYRKGRQKEAIADALKALESTIKAICEARRWAYPEGATAVPLLRIVFENGLVPTFLEGHFGGLRAALEAGLPTLRNRTSGHGQGPVPVTVPDHLVAYALHLCASAIVFLVEAHRQP